jgi:cysteine desulfuration protein SufE
VTDSAPERSDLPAQLAAVVEDFQALGQTDRLQLLLDFSRDLPELPERLVGRREEMEPVAECQSPLFLLVEVGADDVVHLFFDAPAEAPTTRGFASVLREGLDGLTAADVLAVPDDVPLRLGITAAVSPLRLNGMAGMLRRIKRQVAQKSTLERSTGR